MIIVILCFSVVADGCNCSACKQDVLFFLLAPNLYTNSSSNPVLSFLQVVLRWGTFILSKATRKLWSTSSEGPRTWSSCLIKGRTSFLKCKEVLQSLHSRRVFIYRLWFIYERIFHAGGSVTRVQIELKSCSWGGLVVLSNCLLFENYLAFSWIIKALVKVTQLNSLLLGLWSSAISLFAIFLLFNPSTIDWEVFVVNVLSPGTPPFFSPGIHSSQNFSQYKPPGRMQWRREECWRERNTGDWRADGSWKTPTARWIKHLNREGVVTSGWGVS